MFWPKKFKNKKKTDKQAEGAGAGSSETSVSVGTIKGQRLRNAKYSDDVKAEALANIRKAQDHLGKDRLSRMAALMNNGPKNSPADKARAVLKSVDKDSPLYKFRHLVDQ